jgi:KUP system potassium uptake protein
MSDTPAVPVPKAAAARAAVHRHPGLAALSLAALGIVYGDIGTSPLYAFQAAFSSGDLAVNRANVLGVLSCFFWSLVLVVTVKYVGFVMRASNDGEGGVMALMALAIRRASPRERQIAIVLGLVGVALFYGDGLITPAISVLSAIEGTEVATPTFKPFIIPITLAILTGLFVIQRHGTARVGASFGPIMIVWFVALSAMGIQGISKSPDVLNALSPVYAVQFFTAHPWLSFVTLGAVVLCITGTEALYADMGHFGRPPIALAWIVMVLPALTLNYFGQGGLVLADPAKIDSPFYRLAPSALTVPLVILATIATIIASQAVISGAYSLTQQAMQLGYLPRMAIRHTSAAIKGQIYVPAVNWAMYVAIVILVLGFESSARLASAYGIAVTGTMVATTCLMSIVCRRMWGWRSWQTALVIVPFLAIDVLFFSANALKFVDGGWFPLAFGGALFFVMTTWSHGREVVRRRIDAEGVQLEPYLDEIAANPPTAHIPGTAVFLTATPTLVPRALIANRRHNVLLHEHNVLVTVENLDVPRVEPDDRLLVEDLGGGFHRVTIRCGFTDTPDVPAALEAAREFGLDIDPEQVSYFVGRDEVLPRTGSRFELTRMKLFATMHWNAGSSGVYFRLPPDRVIEVGSQILV